MSMIASSRNVGLALAAAQCVYYLWNLSTFIPGPINVSVWRSACARGVRHDLVGHAEAWKLADLELSMCRGQPQRA